MLGRIATTLGLGTLLLATVAWTQVDVRGVVSYVDVPARTVYFTDGRSVYVSPGATITINGQPMPIESVRPGVTAVLLPTTTSTTTVTTVTQPLNTSPPVVTVPPPTVIASSPVNVTGTLASVDSLNQTVTLQDGRIVRIAPNTMVWQQSPALSTLQPGARVFLRDAFPVGYVPAAAAPMPAGQYLMGTVSRVEPASQSLVLTDGTIVHVSPAMVIQSGAGGVAFSQLRPGDEIVVLVTNPRPVTAGPSIVSAAPPVPVTAERYATSALPYQGYADTRIEAAGVRVLWSPQTQ
jgi:hypothetical protein